MTHNICHFGDCRDSMREMIAQGVKVQTVVTSPPYWGLRDYGAEGQFGLEKLHDCLGWATGEPCGECHVCRMVEVFRLVWDLLADDGTLWLNYGDSYAGSWGAQGRQGDGGQMSGRSVTSARQISAAARKRSGIGSVVGLGLKPKDLVGMPWRVAFALQADGWYLRQDNIWHKPNPMPESIRDRCTKAHEYLFLFSKKQRYYYDADAIKEEASVDTHPRRAANGYKTPDGWDTSMGDGGHGSFHKGGREKGQKGYEHKPKLPGNKSHKGTTAYENGDERHRTKAGLVEYAEKQRKLADSGSGTKNNDSFDEAMQVMPDRRNKRDVWTVASQPYKEAHFATFPPALIEPCILAGSRPGDIVFDPFFGSGTTGQVAQQLGRQWIGCELNPEYEPLQKQRTAQGGLAF